MAQFNMYDLTSLDYTDSCENIPAISTMYIAITLKFPCILLQFSLLLPTSASIPRQTLMCWYSR
jgi:hypothetical protein